MIRTRDFILFVVVLVFLFVGITATVVQDTGEYIPSEDIALQDGSDRTGGFGTETQPLDRASEIARLREKIAQSESVIQPQASVSAVAEPEESADTADTVASLQRCGAPDDALSIVPQWPVNDVELETVGSNRVAFTQETVVVTEIETVGTSSVPTESTETLRTKLLSLPLVPQKNFADSCVPSEVVGVSPRGLLIFNGDVRPYRSLSSETLIGYARDGFPIYGNYDGEVDACGGYDHATGYRYTVSSDRDYIIGCFAGTAADFTL